MQQNPQQEPPSPWDLCKSPLAKGKILKTQVFYYPARNPSISTGMWQDRSFDTKLSKRGSKNAPWKHPVWIGSGSNKLIPPRAPCIWSFTQLWCHPKVTRRNQTLNSNTSWPIASKQRHPHIHCFTLQGDPRDPPGGSVLWYFHHRARSGNSQRNGETAKQSQSISWTSSI